MRVHIAAPYFICLRSYARIWATRATSARPAFVAYSIARSYARLVASRRFVSPVVVACSLIASAVSDKYFAAARGSPRDRKNEPRERTTFGTLTAPPDDVYLRTSAELLLAAM